MAELTAAARTVLEARYLLKNERGEVAETPEEMFRRVARSVAAAEDAFDSGGRERYEEAFFQVMDALEFLPNSPTLMNAGTELGQLSACFVLPVGDSIEEIFDALKWMAIVQKSGGGTGFSFSRLRPNGDLIASTGGRSPGPVSFMRIFDCATDQIRQGGKRRGANMGVLRVDHPDILEFVRSKRDGSLANFNISVAATDAFMEAVAADGRLELVNPRTGRPAGELSAREVFEEIVSSAWAVGDPGRIFLDTINRANPTPALGEIETTNPCGEVPLLPFESCTLGSVNLARMLRREAGREVLDEERLDRTVALAVRFLDDVIQVNRLPLEEMRRMAQGNRKIGLGLMGFAEMLIRLRIPYGSREALDLARRLMARVSGTALQASRELCRQRGSFPNLERSIFAGKEAHLRNATRTSIAPTGTISIIAGTSAGIEPLFALAYRRRHVLGERTLVEINPIFLEHARAMGLDDEEELGRILSHGRLGDDPQVPEDVRRIFRTALEIPPEAHVETAAAFQEHADNAVSKTVNLPADATVEDVASVYTRAWERGLKGVTVFRYGSKGIQVLELGAGDEPWHYEHYATCDPTECRL